MRFNPIRVSADEFSYPIHVYIRYEIEKEIFKNKIYFKDIKNLWNENYLNNLSINLISETEGVLQDIHWYEGIFGYFPTYALGAMIASQIKFNCPLFDIFLGNPNEENINNLSGGQLQRVLLARTLTQGADILLLDEAFSAVDIGAEIDLMKIINDIKEDGKTILIATHDIQNIEEKFDEVLCLNRHCCAFGEPSEVLTQEIIEEMYGSHNQILKGHIPGNHGANSGN